MADARVQLILDLREKVLGPLRSIQSGSKDAAAALKSTRDQLRDLEKVQQDMDGLRRTRVQLRGQQRDLQELQTKLAGSNASLTEHRERHKNITASLKTARESHSKLTKALQDGATATPEFSRQLEMARIRLQTSQAAYERSNSTLGKYRNQIKTTEAGITQLSGKIDNGKERLQGFRERLERAGISTDKLGQQSRAQKVQIEAATAAMERQKQTLAGLKAQQEKVNALKEKHGKAMMHTGMVAAAGVGMVAGGRAIARPVQATLGAFSQQEDATTQLSASMMQSDGSVSKEFTEIDALAKRLGDRLPGTTADFIEMMTMLRRQGLSAQSILGGTGEAAALLGVQLRMPVTEAAEFAAKMQDATRTTEKDMLGLMDMIQRTFYLGVDSSNMLQGFTKMSPIMNVIRKDGLEASKMLAPLLVMMDQTGMKGESAGNAFRKIFQSAMNTDKIKKVTDGLKAEKGIDLKLNFTDGKGEFGSIEQMYKELSKLNGLTTEQRLVVIKDLFGDDSETIQALDTMISKGQEGYDEVVAKMQAQADLKQRVDQQLGTLSNVMEAAQGGFTNVMAAIGDTIKDDAKDAIKAIGNITSSIGGWVKEHPALTAGIARTVAVLAGLMIVLGTLLVPLALIAGKFMLMRFLFGMLSIKVPALGTGFSLLGGALKGLIGVVVKFGVALFTTPVGWFVLAIAGAAYLIYKNWGAISEFFSGLWNGVKVYTSAAWESIKASLSGAWSSTVSAAQSIWSSMPGFFSGMWQSITTTASAMWAGISSTLSQIWTSMVSGATALWQQLGGSFPAVLQNISTAIINWSPLGLFYQAFAGVMSYFGVELPTKFSEFGANIIQGLVNGITSNLAMVRDAVGAAANSAVGWFKEKLGIHSPSRVFMAAGVNVGEGAAIGIESTLGMVRKSAAAMAVAAGVTLAAPTMATPVMPAPQIAHPVEQQTLPPQPAQVVSPQPAAAQALPPMAQPLLPALQALLPVTAQVVQLQPPAAQVLPPAAQPLVPTLQNLPPLPAQVVDLQPAAAKALPPAAQPLRPNLQALPPVPTQVVQLQTATAPALPPAAQQLLPTLQKLPPVPAQVVDLQPNAAKVLPPAAQTLQPTLQKLPPVPAQAVDLQPIMQQLQAMPALQATAMPAMADPVQIDRRPALAQRAPAAARPAPVIQGDTITIQIHAAPGMDVQALGREVERILDQRDRTKAARLQASYTDWN